METRQLRYFLAVIDQAGISAAAESLNMAQPSVSQAIQSLERELGVMLFHRVGRKMVLSSAGKDLERRARRIISEIDIAESAMRGFAGVEGGALQITATANDSFYPLARSLAKFYNAYPKVDVKLFPTEFNFDSIEILRSGQAEIAFVPWNRSVDFPDRLVIYRISGSAMYIAVSPRLRVLGEKCSIEEIADIPMITRRKGTMARRLIDEAISRGVNVRILVDSVHDTMLPRLVADGMGCAIMPQTLAKDAELMGASIAEIDPPSNGHILLVHREDRLSPTAERFIQEGVWPASLEAGLPPPERVR